MPFREDTRGFLDEESPSLTPTSNEGAKMKNRPNQTRVDPGKKKNPKLQLLWFERISPAAPSVPEPWQVSSPFCVPVSMKGLQIIHVLSLASNVKRKPISEKNNNNKKRERKFHGPFEGDNKEILRGENSGRENGAGPKRLSKGGFGSKAPSVTDGWGSEATRSDLTQE